MFSEVVKYCNEKKIYVDIYLIANRDCIILDSKQLRFSSFKNFCEDKETQDH